MQRSRSSFPASGFHSSRTPAPALSSTTSGRRYTLRICAHDADRGKNTRLTRTRRRSPRSGCADVARLVCRQPGDRRIRMLLERGMPEFTARRYLRHPEHFEAQTWKPRASADGRGRRSQRVAVAIIFLCLRARDSAVQPKLCYSISMWPAFGTPARWRDLGWPYLGT